MDITLHVGAHGTDDDLFLKCLLRNREDLVQSGVEVPGPSRYRRPLRDMLNKLAGEPPTPEMRDQMLALMCDGAPPGRVVLSNQHFFSVPKLALAKGRFYHLGDAKLAEMQELFAGDRIELYMAICNPAIFIPALLKAAPDAGLEQILGRTDPLYLSWAELIGRLRAIAPDVPITLWCHEDTPLIWPDLLRAAAGRDATFAPRGQYAILRQLLRPEDLAALIAQLEGQPDLDEDARREIIAQTLVDHALPEAMETEVDLPGWDAALVTALTERYDEDVERIEQMEGVTVIRP